MMMKFPFVIYSGSKTHEKCLIRGGSLTILNPYRSEDFFTMPANTPTT